MSDNTSIEWSDATWNPGTGCTKISPGCDHCYAETFAERWRGTPGHHFEAGFDLTLRPERLGLPLKWRKPRRVFVNSMSDLFHEGVPDEFIARVFAVMATTPQHTYQLLTKRHGRMRSLLRDECRCGQGHAPGVHFRSAMSWAASKANPDRVPGLPDNAGHDVYFEAGWPLPNVWLGVSVEDQKWADIRIPALLDTPAAVRWVSAEPLLGPLDLTAYLGGDRGRTEVQGRGRLPSSDAGSSGDRLAGASLACGGQACGPVEQNGTDLHLSSSESGTLPESVPVGARDARRDAVSRAGAPSGVETLLRLDSGGVDGQPQERTSSGQPTYEPGTCHAEGAGSACPRCAEERTPEPVRRAQRDGKTLDGTGADDLFTQSVGRTTAIDRRRLQRADADHLKDRKGRSALSWIVAGGESGPGARPMQQGWAVDLVLQCEAAGVPFFFKQAGASLAKAWGCRDRKGGDPAEWPTPFPREFPRLEAVAP